jgi:hypothetical protein
MIYTNTYAIGSLKLRAEFWLAKLIKKEKLKIHQNSE